MLEFIHLLVIEKPLGISDRFCTHAPYAAHTTLAFLELKVLMNELSAGHYQWRSQLVFRLQEIILEKLHITLGSLELVSGHLLM